MQHPAAFRSVTDMERLHSPSGRLLTRQAYNPHNTQYVTHDGCTVIVSYDTERHGELLHLSVARQRRVPNWAELLDLWKVFSQASPMMIFPNWTQHKSVHNHCLHLYSIPTHWQDYVNATAKAVLPHPINTAKPPPSKHAPVRLSGQYKRIAYENLLKYRQKHYAPTEDVLAYFPLSSTKFRNDVFLMLTLEPWRAGQAV